MRPDGMRPGWQTIGGRRLETAWWGPEPDSGPDGGPVLVLLHEGLGCIALWRDVPERLAAMTGRPVFAYSRAGYGQSDPVTLPRPMTYLQDEARDTLPALLRAEGIVRPILIGHSDGGSIAAVYAGQTGGGPDSPRALVTIAAHYVVEQLNIDSIRLIDADYAKGDLRSRLARYHADPDIAFRGWCDAWLNPDFHRLDLTPWLRTITAPTLGLQGADDPYGTAVQLDCMTETMAAPLTTALIPNAKHSPHLEAKSATLDAIVRFLGTLPA